MEIWGKEEGRGGWGIGRHATICFMQLPIQISASFAVIPVQLSVLGRSCLTSGLAAEKRQLDTSHIKMDSLGKVDLCCELSNILWLCNLAMHSRVYSQSLPMHLTHRPNVSFHNESCTQRYLSAMVKQWPPGACVLIGHVRWLQNGDPMCVLTRGINLHMLQLQPGEMTWHLIQQS